MMHCECSFEGSNRCDEQVVAEERSSNFELWFGVLLAIALALSAAQAFGA